MKYLDLIEMDDGLPPVFHVKGLNFVQTLYSCPEQYDVFDVDGEYQVGYIRLRWGKLSVSYPCVGGKVIFEVDYGDKLNGTF